MRKVMVFGAFDAISGHYQRLLHHAADHGDIVIAVVTRDVNDLQNADMTPTEHDRIVGLLESGIADDIVLEHGNRDNIISQHQPDIVLVGTHQTEILDELHDIATDPAKHDFVIIHVQTGDDVLE
jgi:glycerol-3-phosphate cytidylyltransferase-like family protein